jgi:hypothetical protein
MTSPAARKAGAGNRSGGKDGTGGIGHAGVTGVTKNGLRVSASGRGGRQAIKGVGEGGERAGGRGARKGVKRRNGWVHASPAVPSPLKYVKKRPRSSNLYQKRRGNLLFAETGVS